MMTKEKINFYFILILIGIMRITPFFIIYFVSDILYIIFYYLISYRKKTVYDNLQKVFPNKSKGDINKIAKKFYKNLADIIIEGFKGFAMTEKQMLNRFIALNPEVANKYFDQGKDIIILGSHYANWEWGAVACGTQFKHKTAVLYKPLKNKMFDNYVRNKRARFGVDLVPITNTRDYFILTKKQAVAYVMLADQSPSNQKKAIWVDFFKHKTAFLHGPERYAKMFNIPIVYFDVQRVKRGFYTLNVIDISKDYTSIQKDGLTKIFVSIIEKIIQKKPEDWLWSHKRWKYKSPS